MITPSFKIVASGFILAFFYFTSRIIYHIIYLENTYPYSELLFGIVVCFLGLLGLGILYLLWEREIKIFYNLKKSRKK